MSAVANIPKPEFITLSGDPVVHCGFIHNFGVNIGSNGLDNRTKLRTYLILQSTGKEKESIEDCVLLDPEVGYLRTRKLLQEQIGVPCYLLCLVR